MKPYKIIEETNESITYEFRTIFIYILYAVMAAMLIGIFTERDWLALAGFGLIVLYFLTVSMPYLPVHRKVRKAMRESSVEFSGSKWSLSKPLRMKVRKDVSC